MSEASESLMKARCRVLVQEPFYGHIAMSMEWIPSTMSWMDKEEDKKIGIRLIDGGRIQCLYYPPYINSKNLKQLYGVIQHVIEHLLRLHPVRRCSREPDIWNVATDYCVNGKRKSPRIGYRENRTVILPGDKMLFCPDEQDDNGSPKFDENDPAEAMYKKIADDQTFAARVTSDLSGMIDDHAMWGQSDMSEDEARQIVSDMANEAAAKSQGSMPGHVAELLEELAKPVVRWRELLRNLIGTYVGNKRRTFSRRSRRYQTFGSPGWSHHAASRVTVIADTSGSISTKMMQQFFAEIEAIAHRADIFLLQWDADFQGYSKYRRNDWKKIEICGRGGTDMAAPVDWLEENRALSDCVIMLTDGYCNWPEKRNFPMIFIVSGNDNSKPDWGHTIMIPE